MISGAGRTPTFWQRRAARLPPYTRTTWWRVTSGLVLAVALAGTLFQVARLRVAILKADLHLDGGSVEYRLDRVTSHIVPPDGYRVEYRTLRNGRPCKTQRCRPAEDTSQNLELTHVRGAPIDCAGVYRWVRREFGDDVGDPIQLQGRSSCTFDARTGEVTIHVLYESDAASGSEHFALEARVGP